MNTTALKKRIASMIARGTVTTSFDDHVVTALNSSVNWRTV